MKIEDVKAINLIIDEFEGNTVLGSHIKKAVKAYFNQKKEKPIETYIPVIKEPVSSDFKIKSSNHDPRLRKMFEDADKALQRNYDKIIKETRRRNGRAKKAQKKNK
tara:strand:- start:10 stop:327 length:318 start_codon:yes stop_codon:yes gene_type:complete